MHAALSQLSPCRSAVRWKHFFTALFLAFLALNARAQIIWYTPNPNYSTARNWDERALETIRADTPNPPVQARNLFSYAVCMYDAWAAYDTNAVGFIYHGKHLRTTRRSISSFQSSLMKWLRPNSCSAQVTYAVSRPPTSLPSP